MDANGHPNVILASQIICLIGLLLVTSIGPGWLVVRHIRWSASERFCAAIATSLGVLYLAAGLIYCFDLPRASYGILSLASLAAVVGCRQELRALAGDRRVRAMLLGFGLLFVWALLLLAMVRNYSGGAWTHDWLEHYQRSVFFLERQPLETRFGFVYPLPARPPFMSLLGAFYLGQVGERYELFQIACAFLNLLVFIPGCLLLRCFAPRRPWGIALGVLMVLFSANPLIIQNATFAWTKGLANFYVLAGLALYVRGIRRPDPRRLGAALLALAGAVLVHYSGAPYALFLALHYLTRVFPRRIARWREWAGVMLPAAALLATWLTWSVAHFGLRLTLATNTTVAESGLLGWTANLRKIALNIFYTLVPHPLHVGWGGFLREFYQPNAWGLVRDYVFTLLQTNLILAVGSVAGPVVLWLLVRAARRPAASRPREFGFWAAFVAVCTVVTIATHPTLDSYGVAHVCSQPLVILGVVFLAANFGQLPSPARWLITLGCSLDFLAGILLHFSLQHQIVETIRTPARDVLHLQTNTLNESAAGNAFVKGVFNLNFLGDHALVPLLAMQLLVLVFFSLLVRSLLMRAAPYGTTFPSLVPTAVPAAVVLAGVGLVLAVRVEAKDLLPISDPAQVWMTQATRDPDSARVHSNLALAWYRDGNVSAAAVEAAAALELQPENPLPRFLARVIGRTGGPPPAAGVQAADAVMQAPASAPAQINLGLVLRQHKHLGPALQRFELAARLAPTSAPALAQLGRAYIDLDRITESIPVLVASLKVQPDADTCLLLAYAYYMGNRTSEAVEQLQAALRLRPDFPGASHMLELIQRR